MAAAPSALAANIELVDGCDLYDAIHAANLDEKFGGCPKGSGDDVIILKGDIMLSQAAPWARSNITIRGDNRVYRASAFNYALRVLGGSLTVENLRVVYDNPRNDRVALVHSGRLTLRNTTISNCAVGIYQEKSKTVISGASSVCDLAADDMVVGGDTVVIDLHQEPGGCENLPASLARVSVTVGDGSGLQCQQVGAVGVGNQAVVDAGVVAAVDVWGYVPGAEICFMQAGRVLFLDATTAPRAIAPVESYRSGGETCALLTGPGTVALVMGQTEAERAPEPEPAADACRIHTTGHLKLRATPSLSGAILDYVRRGSTLQATSRTAFWFQVQSGGQSGWIGHKYVSGGEHCA